MIEGVYSKDDRFITTNTGFATFITDKSITGIGLITNNFNGNFFSVEEPLENCCRDFSRARGTNQNNTEKIVVKNKAALDIYPNPNIGNRLVLEYNLKKVAAYQSKFLH